MSSSKRILVYGGKGALGSTCVSYFKSQNWWVASVDIATNEEAHAAINIKPDDSVVDQEKSVLTELETVLAGNKLDAIICVAGGWAGGSASDDKFVANSDLMIKQSVNSSLISAKLASKFLSETGLLTLTGAKAALEPTPSMIGYGMAKAAIHFLVKSLAAPKSGLPEGSSVVAILPVTLDTPMNRKWMPAADTSTWTPLAFLAELLFKWSSNIEARPSSGSLAQIITKDNNTSVEAL